MKKEYTVTVRMLSSMHINAGSAPDSKRIVVKENGAPYIPATLFKGLVREKMSVLLSTFDPDNTAMAERFFGSEGYNRSHVIFDDLLTEQEYVYETRCNVSISRYSRKNNDQALVFSENVSCFDKSGDALIFSGDITLYLNEGMKKYEPYFIEAVKMIDSVGSGKSRGLGLAEVSISEKAC
ncbi:MAG: hypothetical protein J5997_02405 [Oscillospiraceae bacterium]|nr:hypothetical protein [Oscillospiraceae bacterium]